MCILYVTVFSPPLPRALEDKKKAMVAAEEDRRKKALEERREAQKEATMRFKSSLGRIKSTSKGHGHAVKNSKQAFLDCKCGARSACTPGSAYLF